jgi:hypothetical protein
MPLITTDHQGLRYSVTRSSLNRQFGKKADHMPPSLFHSFDRTA